MLVVLSQVAANLHSDRTFFSLFRFLFRPRATTYIYTREHTHYGAAIVCVERKSTVVETTCVRSIRTRIALHVSLPGRFSWIIFHQSRARRRIIHCKTVTQRLNRVFMSYATAAAPIRATTNFVTTRRHVFGMNEQIEGRSGIAEKNTTKRQTKNPSLFLFLLQISRCGYGLHKNWLRTRKTKATFSCSNITVRFNNVKICFTWNNHRKASARLSN